MKAALTHFWHPLEEAERSVYGPWRYCLHHCYVDLVDRAGLIPAGILPAAGSSGESLLEGCDLLILTGGGDPDPSLFGMDDSGSRDPERERPLWDITLYRAARSMDIPVLGICLGMQLIGIENGIPLIQHLETAALHDGSSLNRISHPVKVLEDSMLRTAIGERPVVSSWHHQALAGVPKGFRAAAYSDDGVLEAIESTDSRVIGVQWHPERDSTGGPLMELMKNMAGHG